MRFFVLQLISFTCLSVCLKNKSSKKKSGPGKTQGGKAARKQLLTKQLPTKQTGGNRRRKVIKINDDDYFDTRTRRDHSATNRKIQDTLGKLDQSDEVALAPVKPSATKESLLQEIQALYQQIEQKSKKREQLRLSWNKLEDDSEKVPPSLKKLAKKEQTGIDESISNITQEIQQVSQTTIIHSLAHVCASV